MTDAERAGLIAALDRFPEQLAELVAGLSPAELTTHYLPEEWTVAQNVHHLMDSHLNAYIRCKRVATEENPTFSVYDQDAWAALPDGSAAELAVSLATLRGLHTRWAAFWRDLPSEAFARSGLHPERGPLSLADLLKMYVGHGEAHLDQIQRTLAAGGVR